MRWQGLQEPDRQWVAQRLSARHICGLGVVRYRAARLEQYLRFVAYAVVRALLVSQAVHCGAAAAAAVVAVGNQSPRHTQQRWGRAGQQSHFI